MAIVLNSTIKKEVERMAKPYKDKGLNWDAKASAIVIVRAILIENGDPNMVESKEPDDVKHRQALVTMILPFMTAAINVQRTTLAPAGLMPEVKAAAAVVADELA